VTATYRRAEPDDAARLFALRRDAILALAPAGMSAPDAASWSANLTLQGMEAKLRELEICVAELDGRIVGWGAIRASRLEGLYTDPAFANRGIGSALLGMLEALMRARGIAQIDAETSQNAEGFYLRRGYQPAGPRVGAGREITKRFV
jgi:ribosomal protein S18 acetylase RimI-like enzyme